MYRRGGPGLLTIIYLVVGVFVASDHNYIHHGSVGQVISARRSMTIESVWTAHQEEKYTKGTAYLYFFPSGTTETANIVLKHGDDYFTVQVSPMAGKVKILPEKADPPGDSNDDF